MAVALLVAAGRGERLGSDGPKALVALWGRPMWDWSLDVLRETCDRVVVALPEGVDAPQGCSGVRGGAERSHSVRNALAASGDDPVVVVHDAARPLVTAQLVRACIAGLEGADAAIAAARMTDTVKESDDGDLVTRTLDRSKLWAIQTPQVFRRDVLERALAQPDDVLARATDDASLVEELGGRVRLIEASRTNLKVTTPSDLELARWLLRANGSPRPSAP